MYRTKRFGLLKITSGFIRNINSKYYEVINNPTLNQYTDRCRYFLTEQECDEYIDNNFVFGIFNDKLQHVGNIGIDNIDHINRTCEIGLFIWEQNQGVAQECLPVVVKHCFDRLNMQRVWMGTLAKNLPMQTVAHKCSFHLEGKQKRTRILNGEYQDVFIYVKFDDGEVK